MKIIRKLARNGNCTTVSLPNPLLDFLRWRCGDFVVIEAISRTEVRLRIPEDKDMRAPLPSTRVAHPIEAIG